MLNNIFCWFLYKGHVAYFAILFWFWLLPKIVMQRFLSCIYHASYLIVQFRKKHLSAGHKINDGSSNGALHYERIKNSLQWKCPIQTAQLTFLLSSQMLIGLQTGANSQQNNVTSREKYAPATFHSGGCSHAWHVKLKVCHILARQLCHVTLATALQTRGDVPQLKSQHMTSSSFKRVCQMPGNSAVSADVLYNHSPSHSALYSVVFWNTT